MKKIILVLMFSVGLVSAANIDAVCGEDKYFKDTIQPSDLISEVVDIVNHHSKEFKIDNKESICAYMNVYDLSFLNTQLTQDDIENFERYMAEKGEYESYEKYRESYLQVLKLFKYYHKYIPSYKTQEVYDINGVMATINNLQNYNGAVELYRYVYGKRQQSYNIWGSSFNGFKDSVAKKIACSETTANSKEELVECAKNKKILPPIVKWAESNVKQSKQKGGQK